MTLLDKFTDPEMIRQLSFGEKISASIYVTLLGMGITFVALGVVWGFVFLLSKIGGSRKRKEKAVIPSPGPVVPESKVEMEKGDLIAVITAALEAGRAGPGGTFRVKKITRTVDATPLWGQVGRIEQLDTTVR